MPASILVVEDNEDNLSLIHYLLRAHGFTPTLARTGADGCRIALKERPDVVLLDIRMPGMDGYAVAAAIKSVRALDHTRVVAVTASAMVGDRERIAAAGFDGYIQKPIDPERFMQTLEQFLPEQPLALADGSDRAGPRRSAARSSRCSGSRAERSPPARRRPS